MRKLHHPFLNEPPIFYKRTLPPAFLMEEQFLSDLPIRRPSPVCDYLSYQKKKTNPPVSRGVEKVKSVQEFKKQIKAPEIQQTEEKVRQKIKIMANSPLRSLYKKYCKSKKESIEHQERVMRSGLFFQSDRQRRSPAYQKLSRKIDQIKLQMQPKLDKQGDNLLLDHVLGRVHKILQQHQQRETVWNQQKRQYLKKIRQLQSK